MNLKMPKVKNPYLQGLVTLIVLLTVWIWLPLFLMAGLAWFVIVEPYAALHRGIWGKTPPWYDDTPGSNNGFD